MINLLKPFIVALVISLIGTPIVIKLANKLGFVDIPKDNRRMHKKPMPLIGGVAMYVSFVICTILFTSLNKEIILLLIGATLILISGLIDDKVGLSPKMKILFQVISAIILIISGSEITFFTNPFSFGEQVIFLQVLAIPITIFWVVGITNTVNLIDGLDGLAAGVSAISAVSLAVIAIKFGYSDVSKISIILAGSCIGFLFFNFNPAKIFMGDTGALFLGYILSYISIEGVMKSAAALTIVVPVLILGVPVFDTTFAMIRRKLSGKKIMDADKGHLHHRLLNLGLSQRQTVLILYGISIIFGILANIVADINTKNGFIISLLIVLAVVLIAWVSGMFKSKEEI